ncbi:MAG: hypothetical protein AAFX76_08425, partial [Planctomycetota bacterium]
MKRFARWTTYILAPVALALPAAGSVIVFEEDFTGFAEGPGASTPPNITVTGNFGDTGIIDFDANDNNGPVGDLVAFLNAFGPQGAGFTESTELLFDTQVTTQAGFEYTLDFDLFQSSLTGVGDYDGTFEFA